MPTGSETILIAEDDIQVRKTISWVLRENGYTIIEASDGKSAYSLANGQ